MIHYLEGLLETSDGKILYILTLLMVLMIIDFIMGVCIARFDTKVKFSSFKMKIGILVKIVEVLLAIIAIPFVLLLNMGLELLYVLYIGLCASEIYSILGHIKLVDDDNKGINLMDLFFKKLMNKGDNNK